MSKAGMSILPEPVSVGSSMPKASQHGGYFAEFRRTVEPHHTGNTAHGHPQAAPVEALFALDYTLVLIANQLQEQMSAHRRFRL